MTPLFYVYIIFIQSALSNKIFAITIDDNGNLKTTEVQ